MENERNFTASMMLALALGSAAALLATDQHAVAEELSYAAKVVCRTRNNDQLHVVSGTYGTTVNIHNPHELTVNFRKRASQALTQRHDPGQVTPYVDEKLGPGASLGVDCTDIKNLFAAPPAFVDGFLELRVPPDPETGMVPELNVVAVYTAKHRTEPGAPSDVESIDVERFEPRLVLGGEQLPDLTIRLTNPPISVSCPGGQGTCTHTVDFEVRNLSAVDVLLPFEVSISTDHGMAQTLPVAGLGAGVVLPMSVTLGPGANCYNPNCTVTGIADSGGVISESNETNNTDVREDLG